MNRIFSKVWSKALGRWVVASELASRQRAGSNRGASTSVGSASHNLLGAAVTVALLGLPIEVLAGNGIHINSGSDGECVSINEPAWDPIRRTQTELLNYNINFKDVDGKCLPPPVSPTGVLFYRPASVAGVGATSLGLGGDLVVGGTLSLNPGGLGKIQVQSLQMGNKASALGQFDWALGENSVADGDKVDPDNGNKGSALALGNSANALHASAVAVGVASNASGARSTAVGAAARATGHFSTAIGRFAQAMGNSATALGRDTVARSEQSTAVGYGARTATSANRAVAIGASAQANGVDSLAMGSGALASSDMANAIAIGKDSRGNAGDAIALGGGAVSEHFNSVALGATARTSPHRVVAPVVLNGTRYSFLPEGLAVANVNGVVSVGGAAASRQIINVAPGVLDATSYDAVNGSQLFAAYQEINKLGQKDMVLAAKDAELEDRLNKLPKGVDGESLAAAIGPGAQVDGNGRISLPELTLDSLGRQSGDPTAPAAQPTSLLGAIGALDGEVVKTNAALGTLFDSALLWDGNERAYSARNGTAEANRIANVAAGIGLQDAVNVGQLQGVERSAKDARTIADTAQRAADAAQLTANEAKAAAGSASTQLAGIGPQETVAGRIQDAGQSVADALGGGASANADGTVSAPSYGVAMINADGSTGPVTQHGNVGDALNALDQSVGTVNDRVDGLARDSLRWNDSLGAYDAAHDGQASSQIANVAAGVNTTDAVNVGQLNTVDQAAKAAQSAAGAAQNAADGAQRTADGAASAANRAQATADSAANAAATAAADAGNAQRTADGATTAASTAQRAADAAQLTANEAKAAAGSASTQLAGIGPQETVAGRIQDAGQSVADALGGGASANADGTVSAPSYGVAMINADGSTGPVTQHGNVGDALNALDQNVGTVNDRVDGLARDSLRWNDSLGAYDAAHDGQASSQIANVAAGVNTTDAVNVGQLNTVDQAARTAQSAAGAAQNAADGAQRTADDAAARATTAQVSADRVGGVANAAQQAANAAGEGVIRAAAEAEQTRNQIVRGEIGLVKKDPQSKILTIGKDTGGDELDVSGHEGGRRVTGIAAGRIDDASTDAVTGAQLNALDKRVQRADALGEGVAVDRPGAELPAARAEKGSGAIAVGAGAAADGAGSVAVGQGAATTAAQATALGNDAVASAPGSVALGAGSRADRPNALSVGAVGAERQITHVAPATRDTDAVNLAQARSLSRQEAGWALVQANGYTDRQIKQLRRESNAGIALSMSMAGLPSSFVPGGRMIAMAGSTYGGESAVALGFSAVSEDGSFMFRASGSTTTEDHGFTIGVGFQW